MCDQFFMAHPVNEECTTFVGEGKDTALIVGTRSFVITTSDTESVGVCDEHIKVLVDACNRLIHHWKAAVSS